MTLKAYQNVQRAVEDPRATEYRLFGQVTGALMDAKNTNAKGTALVEAVDWNSRLWRTLAADCMDDRNALTQDVRAKIVSLSLFVSKYSRKVTREKAPTGSPDPDQPQHHAGPGSQGRLTLLNGRWKKPVRNIRAGFLFGRLSPRPAIFSPGQNMPNSPAVSSRNNVNRFQLVTGLSRGPFLARRLQFSPRVICPGFAECAPPPKKWRNRMSFSVNTNTGAMTALQYLNQTQGELAQTQNEINSGLKVASAKDNGAIYAIAQNQRGAVAGFSP